MNLNLEQIHKKHPGLVYKISFLFAFVAVFTFLALRLPNNSEAASLANFKPGNIISDYTMSNYESMTVEEIDQFLHNHGNCNNTETYKAAWYPSVHYHIKDGHFVCLADEVFAEGVKYGDLIPEGTKSRTAAQVIYDTAHEFKINPQVLIVLLEKEQGLISDSWPNSLQYRSATGFGCPDTAPCNELYYGFVNQLDNAAYLFRTVLDGGWTNYPLGENYIYYNPNRACGGSTVNIENLATSSLYRYTPYQPNAAALAAGYGTVTCGAYGNRNFYLFFMDWFGDPTLSVDPIVEAETKFEQPVTDGIYQFVSKAYPDKAIDIRGGIKDGMVAGDLQVFTKKEAGADNQSFEIKYNSTTGYYNIFNPATGLLFDVKGGRTDDSTGTQIHQTSESCNQDWLFEQDDDGYYVIISRCSSKTLDVGASTKSVNIFKYHGGDNQKWLLNRVDSNTTQDDAEEATKKKESKAVEDESKTSFISGSYQFISKAYPDKAIDIRGGIKVDMVSGSLQVFTKKESGADNQTFQIKYNSTTGYYSIINPATGLSFDVKGARTENSTGTQVFAAHNACNQEWSLEKDADGYYTIASRCSGKVLDVGASTMSVNIFDIHNGDNQKWLLIKIDE